VTWWAWIAQKAGVGLVRADLPAGVPPEVVAGEVGALPGPPSAGSAL